LCYNSNSNTLIYNIFEYVILTKRREKHETYRPENNASIQAVAEADGTKVEQSKKS